MALDNKVAIETEFTNKAQAIIAITPAQVDQTLKPVDDFVVQVTECREVLLAREALNARPLTGEDIDHLKALVDQVQNAAATIRAAVPAIQGSVQKFL